MRSRWGRARAALVGLALAVGGCAREGSGAADVPVGTEEGQRAPALEGRRASGEPFSLAAARGSPVVVVFYQGAYCGLCREQLSRLQKHLSAYRALDAQVVAATPDPPATGAQLGAQLGLEFPLVTVDSATLAGWGAGPRPATYVVGRDGVVAFRHLGRNAADRPSDVTLLTILERLERE